VIGFGGVFGIGRRCAAVPIAQVALDETPVRVAIERQVLHRAPVYDPDAPFSRREEQVVCGYFGCDPYWG
jgi:hypothetical protein